MNNLTVRRSLLASFLPLLLVTQAVGHSPDSIESEMTPENPKKSWALYGEFLTGEEVFTVKLAYDEGFALPLEVLVPQQDVWADHRPVFAVVGPGLPAPTAAVRDLLPKSLPDNVGVYYEPNDQEERATFYEPFLGTDFWTSEPIALTLDAGEHEIWIWSPNETTGRFTFGFGVEEEHGPSEIFELIFNADAYDDSAD